MIVYSIFSIGLFLWTTASVKYEVSTPMMGYLAGVAVLGVVLIIAIITSIKSNNQMLTGLLVAAAFANLGMSINYRCFDKSIENPELLADTYLGDLLIMIVGFVVVYLIVRFTIIYRFRAVKLILACLLPISIFGARLTGGQVGGSYIYFAGIMIFGLVLAGYPFVAAAFMSANENRYLMGNVKNISWNQISFLIYNFVLYIGCVFCNEFGLILILGLTSSVMFLIWCKDTKSKLLYTVTCAAGAVLAGMMVSHLASRIQIWLSPASAYGDESLAEQAESVLYLFRHFNGIGWWGNGIGSLSSLIYPTLNTDHALLTLMSDYSPLLAIVVIALGVLLVRWMLITPKKLDSYDRYLNQGCALIVCFIILIDIASNLGSFITAGIGYPWVSDGSSINVMLSVLIAIHCGLLRKGEKGSA